MRHKKNNYLNTNNVSMWEAGTIVLVSLSFSAPRNSTAFTLQ